MPSSELDLKQRARNLRDNMTEAERRLWLRIKGNQMGSFKFYRQKVIGGYVADFYCHRAKLAIEVDGADHRTHHGIEQDGLRDQYMKSLGITVLRFTNDEVLGSIDGVIRIIRERLELK